MPTEERRLVEEEGSLSKKTWLRKKEVRAHWVSSCPGPQWRCLSEPVSSCPGPGSGLFSVTHCHLELLSGRAWLGVRWVLRPWHLESAVLLTSLHKFPDVINWTTGRLVSSYSGPCRPLLVKSVRRVSDTDNLHQKFFTNKETDGSAPCTMVSDDKN